MNSRWKNQDTNCGGGLVTAKKGRRDIVEDIFLIFSIYYKSSKPNDPTN